MLNFRLHLPLVLYPLYTLFPQVQAQLPPGCATQCSSSAASQAGCGPHAPSSSLTMPVTFQQAATSCVMQVCSASDAEAAVAYFGSLCPSAAPLAPAASASTSPVTSPSQAALSSPTDIFSNSTTSASLQQIGSTVEKEGPQKTITISSQPISNAPTPPSSSSSSGSATASPPARASPSEASPSSSPLSSNAAATPRRAATLVAGGIGALFAVAV